MLALYHQFNRPSVTMHIVAEHGDGTVSLALTQDGSAHVRCALGSRYGQATPLVVQGTVKAPKIRTPKTKPAAAPPDPETTTEPSAV